MRFMIGVLALGLMSGCGGGSGSSNGGGTRTQTGAIVLTSFVTGLTSPLGLEQPNDGSGNFFVVEQAGKIRIIQNGTLSTTPFLDITAKVTSGGETGLLGLAFHPSYQANGKFYVNYTRTLAGQLQTVIAQYTRSAGSTILADPASESILFTVDQPFANHNGGQLVFGPDGFLYIGLGDGGSSGDPFGNGQNKNVLLGKMLRIDVDHPANGKNYGIPPDNPFSGGGGAPEIFAYGFRNPWRFSFDRTTSRFFVADVGQDKFEEIDLVTNGGNYGWNIMEGSSCYNASTCTQTGLILPLHSYPHTDGIAVIGGFVYRGSLVPSLVGSYIFGDFGSGRIWMLTETTPGTWTRTDLASSGRAISSFGRDQNGELYVVDYGGSILQVKPQ